MDAPDEWQGQHLIADDIVVPCPQMSAGRGHDVRAGQVAPDGSLLASVDGTTVRVWAVDIDDLLEIARQNVTRSLTFEECRQYLHVEACPASSALAGSTTA